MNAYLSEPEIAALGLASVGDRVGIHRSSLIINAGRLSIGSDVRIDAFSVVTCGDEACLIDDHVHISTHVLIAGRAGFDICKYAGIAAGARLLSTSDDFSGDFLTGPTFPPPYTNALHRRIVIGEHAVVGANCIVMPGGGLEEGAILGSLSLTKTMLQAWHIHGGVPARMLKERSRKLLGVLEAYEAAHAAGNG
ncbi:MAG: hypothetical protein K5872_18020 [Rhizobiaceae bacterium]|nr:hypothetical protein [Rhizobiaceae bacterium]MCV0408123.1 hypothetical protein [Rhizobiaceae bacterium]